MIEDQDPAPRYVAFRCRFLDILEYMTLFSCLCDDPLCISALELVREFTGCICWIGGEDDCSGANDSKYQDRVEYTVRGM